MPAMFIMCDMVIGSEPTSRLCKHYRRYPPRYSIYGPASILFVLQLELQLSVRDLNRAQWCAWDLEMKPTDHPLFSAEFDQAK